MSCCDTVRDGLFSLVHTQILVVSWRFGISVGFGKSLLFVERGESIWSILAGMEGFSWFLGADVVVVEFLRIFKNIFL